MEQPVQYDLIDGQDIHVEMKSDSNKYLLSDNAEAGADVIKIKGDFTLTSYPSFSDTADFSALIPDTPYPKIEKSKNRGQIALCGLSRKEKKLVEKLRNVSNF